MSRLQFFGPDSNVVDADLAVPRAGVLVLHDEDVMHWGFRLLLSQQAWVRRTLAAHCADDAIALARRYDAKILIADLDAGHRRVSDDLRQITSDVSGLRIVLLAGRHSISVSAARAIGAVAILPKTTPAPELTEALRRVAAGRLVFVARPPAGGGRLTTREREVLVLLFDGATNREIGSRLQLSPDTVKQHAAAIYRKLNVRNRTEAARRAEELGLVFSVAA